MFKLPKTPPPEDMFSQFPAEHADLWPKGKPEKQSPDAFSEFDAEDESGGDRWLAVARSQQPASLKVAAYRPPLAVAAVVLSLFTPAAIISTLIVDRQLAAARDNLLTTSPSLPVSLLDASIARLPESRRPIEIRTPAGLKLESNVSRAQTESKLPAPPARPPSVPAAPKPPPTRTSPSSSGVMPLTTAVLSSALPTSPAPVPAGSTGTTPGLGSPPAPATPPPAPAASPPVPAGLPAMRVASPSSSATVPPPPETISPSAAVRNAIDRYRRGFNELDSGEVKAIWPEVDERALARAFSQLSRQLFVFDSCNVDVKGVLATASCRGRAQYVPKVGNKSPRVEMREWTFLLRRGPDDWWIERVDSK